MFVILNVNELFIQKLQIGLCVLSACLCRKFRVAYPVQKFPALSSIMNFITVCVCVHESFYYWLWHLRDRVVRVPQAYLFQHPVIRPRLPPRGPSLRVVTSSKLGLIVPRRTHFLVSWSFRLFWRRPPRLILSGSLSGSKNGRNSISVTKNVRENKI